MNRTAALKKLFAKIKTELMHKDGAYSPYPLFFQAKMPASILEHIHYPSINNIKN